MNDDDDDDVDDDDDDDDDDDRHLDLVWRGSDIAISHGHPGQNRLCIKTVVALDIDLQFFIIICDSNYCQYI